MSMKTAYRKHEYLISILAIIVGAYMLMVGLFGTFLSDYSPEAFISFADAIGAWKWWVLVFGIILVFIFSIMVILRTMKLQEFKKLYNTESKSKFRKNIARIETLALKLGPEYEDKVIEKEEEFDFDR